jgi:peptidoglycan/xylan/chitin deacetylase (PgdA/CDA1 family)
VVYLNVQFQSEHKFRDRSLSVIAGLLAVTGLVVIGWLWGHKVRDEHHAVLRSSDSIKVDQYDQVVEISYNKTLRAIALFKANEFQQAVDELIEAVNICPLNTLAYQLLTHAYLTAGREMEMYDVIDRSGDSYADLNKVMATVDDAYLDKIPLEEPQDKVFLASFPENKKMAISFMFDDGEADIYQHLNIFEKYGFRATIPIVAGFVGTSPHWGTWKEWKDAADRGFEIANHSMYHRDVSRLSGNDLDISINQSDALIEKKIGREVTAFVFPGGKISKDGINHALQVSEVIRSLHFLRNYYNRTVGIVYGGPFFSISTANRLVDIAIKRRLWVVAKAHGITVDPSPLSYKAIDPSLLDAHLAYIHSRSHDVYVDTFSHIFEYLQLRRNTRIVIKGLSRDSADIILHSDSPGNKLTRDLTVVLRAQVRGQVSAKTAGGRDLKAWSCDLDKCCVDVDSYDEKVHVQW